MTKTTKICDLPMDLLMEIVRRVPLRDMRVVRLTCKSWDTLWKSGIFKKMHMHNDAAREAGVSRMVLIMGWNLHLIRVDVADVDHPSTESRGKLSCPSLAPDFDMKIIKVFHCDGILLCVLKGSFRLLVWNPYLGQTRWIKEPSYSYRMPDGVDRYRYAFGYDHEKKSHKILRFMDDDSLSTELGHFGRYQIYDFDSNLWRTLDVGTPHWYIYFHAIGVPLNGNTYWLAKHRNSDYQGSDRLICFDFTSESFGPILPQPLLSEEEDGAYGFNVIRLLSCLKGEKLSLLLAFVRPSKLEIWVTDPNNVSWSKLFKVDTGPATKIGFSFSGFFVDEEKNVAMVFDKSQDTRHTLNVIGEAGFFIQVVVDPFTERARSWSRDHAYVCSYVPSLVQMQIKKPVFKRVFKRKQRSKFEIHPCQQKKLRRRLDHEEKDGPSAKRKLNQVILDEEEEDYDY